MIIPVLPVGLLPVKTGIRRNVNFAAEDRVDPRSLRRLVKVDDSEHNSMVCNGSTVHPELFHP